jgi:hypothetical protein
MAFVVTQRISAARKLRAALTPQARTNRYVSLMPTAVLAPARGAGQAAGTVDDRR